MKRTTTLILLLIVCTLSYGQSYHSLWKDFEKNISKDLPKSALEKSQDIYAKAVAEGNSGQMLKAALVSLQLHHQIAPDSAVTYLTQLESAASHEKRPIEKALFNLVFARLHSNRQKFNNTSEGDLAIGYLKAATANPDIFNGHLAEEFIPATIKGNDSEFFNHDLRHVICREAMNLLNKINYSSLKREEIDRLRNDIAHEYIEFYRDSISKNENAIVLATLDSVNNERESLRYGRNQTDSSVELAKQLISQYPQSPCTVEAYIHICKALEHNDKNRKALLEWARRGVEAFGANPRSAMLHNIIRDVTRPHCSADFPMTTMYEGQKIKIAVEAVNTRNVKISFYRLPYAGYDAALHQPDFKKLRKKVSKPTYTVSTNLDWQNDYDNINDTLDFSAGNKGIYLAEMETDGKISNEYHIVYVSDIRIMHFNLPSNKVRLMVVEARNGRPIPGTSVNEYTIKNNERILEATYTTDNKGELVLAREPRFNTKKYFPYKDEDVFSQGYHFNDYSNYGTHRTRKNTETKLFTDRAIYRPGQKVHVGGIIYARNDDEFNTLYNESINLILRDANYKEIARKETKSDEFGAFGTDFDLPQSCLNGSFYVQVNNRQTKMFRVEEYKRPTFEIKTAQPEGGYALGDTVNIKCNAMTFTGVGVPGAKVIYSVKQNVYGWGYRNEKRNVIYRDTTITDNKGNFDIHVPLTAEKEGASLLPYYTYNFISDITVTSNDGESQTVSTNLTAGKNALDFTSNLQKMIMRYDAPPVTLSLQNAAKQPVYRKGEYTIYKDNEKCASGDFTTNKSFEIFSFRALPSGKYKFEARVKDENDSTLTVKSDFTLFSLSDKRPAEASDIWYYASSPSLSDYSDVYVQIGTSMHDVTAFYDVVGNGKIIESRRFSLSDTIVKLQYRYKEEYGHGISITFGFMHDGKIYSKSERLTKPEPDKRLRFKWTTFRNRLQPGKKEEWHLNIYEPDGTPAKASAVAALYDASLDKFAKNYWNAALGFFRYVPTFEYSYRNNGFTLSKFKDVKYTTAPKLEFDRFDENLFKAYAFAKESARTSVKRTGAIKDLTHSPTQKRYKQATNAFFEKAPMFSVGAPQADIAIQNTETQESGEPVETEPTIKARENFAETAFFMPLLKTDDKGQLFISFTTPESMTKWNLKLLAHTKSMNIGTVDTTTVVAKDFMIRPNMPRFLRAGDKATIAATLRNMTAKKLSGTVYLTLTDAKTEAIVEKRRLKFGVEAFAQSTVQFSFSAPVESSLLICRITADAGTYADGEQHYLPVLANETENISARPFTIKGKGEHKINIPEAITDLTPNARNKRLTIEYTSNPIWYAVQALPCIDKPQSDNAISLATAYYATVLEQNIARFSPDLAKAAEQWTTKQNADTLLENALLRNEDLKNTVLNETPWVAEAENIDQRRRHLAQAFNPREASKRSRNLVERLKLLQQQDGGWSWFPGMHSNYYVTANVLHLLVRLERLTNLHTTDNMINKGINYLNGIVEKRITGMKELENKEEIRQIDNNLITYLDILRLADRTLSSTAKSNSKYLVGKLATHPIYEDLHQKAMVAMILAESGHKGKAETTLQSLMEHTVEKPDMGRYFDTDLAKSSWDSYKIPTHVAAIEALNLIKPDDKDNLQQMLTWLIQAKRTQTWSNETNTVNAVYALLSNTDSTNGMFHFKTITPESITVNFKNGNTTKMVKADQQEDGTPGYIRRDYNLDNTKSTPTTITINKEDDGISWGGIYHRTIVPVTSTTNDSTELSVERKYLILKNDKYVEINNNLLPKTGERIRIEYTITAARDFDFVSLQDAHPACLEPVTPLSGYRWSDGIAYYNAMHDASQSFFFEQMRKGVHTIYSDFTVDRTGKYLVGTAVVQCVYSPEFIGNTKGFTITIQK